MIREVGIYRRYIFSVTKQQQQNTKDIKTKHRTQIFNTVNNI